MDNTFTMPANGNHSLSGATGILYEAMRQQLTYSSNNFAAFCAARADSNTVSMDTDALTVLVENEAHTYFFRKLRGSGFNAQPDLELMRATIPDLYQEAERAAYPDITTQTLAEPVKVAYLLALARSARVFTTVAGPVMQFLRDAPAQ